MRVVFLLVDVPEHRLPRPLRTHERVLAAYDVEIAAPEQLVVKLLTDERQDLNRQPART